MQLETLVLESSVNEEMDLGDAREAYDSYPEAKSRFHSNFAEFRRLLESLGKVEAGDISNQVEKQVDAAANAVEKANREYLALKTVLFIKLNSLLSESQDLIEGLAYHCEQSDESLESDLAGSLLEKAKMQNPGEILSSIEYAYKARGILVDRLSRAQSQWMQRHRERCERFKESA